MLLILSNVLVIFSAVNGVKIILFGSSLLTIDLRPSEAITYKKKNIMIIVVLSGFAFFEQIPLIGTLRKLFVIAFLLIENTSRGRKDTKASAILKVNNMQPSL